MKVFIDKSYGHAFYLAPTKFERLNISMELENFGYCFSSVRAYGIVTKLQLRKNEWQCQYLTSYSKQRYKDEKDYMALTVVIIALSFRA